MLYDLSVIGSKRKPEPGLVFLKSSFNLFSTFFQSRGFSLGSFWANACFLSSSYLFCCNRQSPLTKPFHGPVKLTLTIYDPNPLDRKDRHDYLGDLDSHIAGVFESLQPSPLEINKFKVDPRLKENNDIRNDKELIVADDAQISTVLAKKQKNEGEPFYIVVVEKE